MIVTDLGMIDQDLTLIIDKSGSMAKKDGEPQSRWERVEESTIALAAKCDELDNDGITVYVFSTKFTRYEGVSAAKVEQIFEEEEPSGKTNLVGVLEDAIDNYFKRLEAGEAKEAETIIVVCDGEPTEGYKPTMKLLIDTTQKLDSGEQLNFSFIQVGKDEGAKSFLKALDDKLISAGAKFDIVDTKTIDEMENMKLTDVLLAAIND